MKQNYLTDENISTMEKCKEEYEKYLYLCNHKTNKGGEDDLIYDKDTDMCYCKICKRKIRFVKADINVQEKVNEIINIIDSLKFISSDISREEMQKICDTIPVLLSLPELFQNAIVKDLKNNPNFNNIPMMNSAEMLSFVREHFEQ